MNRPLLLYVTDSQAFGGAEGYLQTLLLHADQKRYRVGLMLPLSEGTQMLVKQAQEHGLSVTFFGQTHREGLKPTWVAQAALLLRKLKPTIVHFNLPSPRCCAETILAAYLINIPQRLATFHLAPQVPPFGGLMGKVRELNRKFQYRTLQRGITVSPGNKRLLIEQQGFPAERLTLIPNGVDTQVFYPRIADETLRERWGIPSRVPLIGLVGRLSRQKGHTNLFAALPKVWEVFPEAHLVLVGEGELEASLRTQAAQLDSQGRIHFVGQQVQMPQVLATLDLFVLPSLYEGLPFALLEAMAMERAIVATAVDGTVDLLTHQQEGLLIPPGEVAPLATAMIHLLGDENLRQQLGQAARRKVVNYFEQKDMIAQTFSLYR